MTPITLTKSTDGSPEEVRATHRRQAGRLLKLVTEHEPEIDPVWLRTFQRAAFAYWIDGREA